MGISDSSKPNVEKMENEKDVDGLINALKDESGNTRREAAALGNISDTRAAEPLIQALEDEHDYVRREAAYALGKIGGARAVEPLIQLLNDKIIHVRIAAVHVLGRIGDGRAIEPLAQAVKDENSEVRKAAARALGEIRDERAVEPLIQALKDEDSYVRSDAAEALGRIGDATAIEPLINTLKDEHPIVRERAAKALANMGKPAVEPLTQALKDGDSRVRDAAKEALGQNIPPPPPPPPAPVVQPLKMKRGFLGWLLGWPNVESLMDRGDVEGIIKALSHRDQGVRRQAAEALGMIKDPSSVAPLLGVVQSDPAALVRFEAKRALRAIGGPGYIQALKIELEDKSWDTHHWAANELESIAEKSTDSGLRAEITAALEKAERDEDRKFRKIGALKGVPSYRVTVTGVGIISWPNVCCVCLGPVEKTVKATGSELLDMRRYREVTVEGVPYCKFCYERESDAVRIQPSFHEVEFWFENPEYGKRFLLANKLWGARAQEEDQGPQGK